MNKAASKLLKQLTEAKDSTTRRDLAKAICDALINQHGAAICAPSKVPEVVQALGKALCPLLQTALQSAGPPQQGPDGLRQSLGPMMDAALQQHDTSWKQPSRLSHLDACSLLLRCLSKHLSRCFRTPAMGHLLGSLQASGLLEAMPNALSAAASVLMARDSPAPTDFTFTQYLFLLLEAWSDLFRRTPSEALQLQDDDPLAPLLLPGATLAAAALAVYAGADGDRIRAVNHCATGHPGTVVLSMPYPEDRSKLTPAAIQQMQQQMLGQIGSAACASVIANALLVADTMSIITYNAARLVIGPQQPGQPAGFGGVLAMMAGRDTLVNQVLTDVGGAVSKLVAAMLFVQVKGLHTQQAGKAGVAAPRTRTSGRIKQGASSASGNARAVQVPPHHNLVADALGLDLLLADEELFLDVTGSSPPGDACKPVLTPHYIDSTIIDPLLGLLAILKHLSGTADTAVTFAVQSTLRPSVKARAAAHMSDELSQAVMLTAIELCLLSPKEHAENALRLSQLTASALFNSFVSASRAEEAARGPLSHTTWVEGPNPLDIPKLHALMAPVARDSVVLLVPLLLPECHDIPLPASEAANPSGSVLSALMPQQILTTAAVVDHSVLAQLLQEHPLYTTRGLEAALRVDCIEQSVSAEIKCAVLNAIPAVLASCGLPTVATSSAAAAAAAPGRLPAALAAPNSRQLLLQLHGLLASVAKYAAGLNGRALAAAASSEVEKRRKEKEQEAKERQQMDELFASNTAMLLPEYRPSFDRISNMFGKTDSTPSSAGQFRGTLELMSGVAAAAAALGRAVNLAAAGGTATPAVSATSSSACSAGSSSRDVQPLLAPFVSLIGRCLYLTGAALSAASTQAPPRLEPAEFASCSSILAALLSCLEWLAAEPGGCQELLTSTGAADAAAVSELCGSLHAQQLLQGEASAGAAAPLQGLAVADRLCESGLTGQLQAVGAAMCGVSAGVCGNPGCLCLLELSEIALLTPGGSKRKGCGKCSACATTSYCSRDCQKAHWRSGHKAFCRAHQQPAAAPLADAAPAAAPGEAVA